MAVSNTILLSDGSYFDFDAPEFPQDAETLIEVIAHSLANLCRFTGHCRYFYSVAEHSVHMSRIVPPRLAFAALLHDGGEAFVGDIAKPLKVNLLDHRAFETRVEKALYARLGLPFPLPPEIKDADRAMLRAEQQQAMVNEDRWLYTYSAPPAPVTLQFWEPMRAKAEFLARYQEILRET